MATLHHAIASAVLQSKEDGCTRYISARIERDARGNMSIHPEGYRVTDWSDDACVVYINGRGEWEYTVERKEG